MNDKLREILNRVYGVYGTLNSADAIKEIEKSFLIIPKKRVEIVEEHLWRFNKKGKLYFIADEANR